MKALKKYASVRLFYLHGVKRPVKNAPMGYREAKSGYCTVKQIIQQPIRVPIQSKIVFLRLYMFK
jgi:hypothetical protein